MLLGSLFGHVRRSLAVLVDSGFGLLARWACKRCVQPRELIEGKIRQNNEINFINNDSFFYSIGIVLKMYFMKQDIVYALVLVMKTC
jgi:hypothetical protein